LQREITGCILGDRRGRPSSAQDSAKERLDTDIICPALLMAERAIILMPLVRARMDPEVVHTGRILIKIVSGHNCRLDAKQLLA